MPATSVEAKQAKYRRRAQKKRELLNALKLEKGCVDCGYKAHPAALDFDHVRGEKSFSLSQTSAAGLAGLKAEAAKCDVRCANCHRIVTWARNLDWNAVPVDLGPVKTRAREIKKVLDAGGEVSA